MALPQRSMQATTSTEYTLLNTLVACTSEDIMQQGMQTLFQCLTVSLFETLREAGGCRHLLTAVDASRTRLCVSASSIVFKSPRRTALHVC